MDATAAAIGIDIGSAKAVLAAVRKGGIDIILSDTTNKSTPLVVAYTDEERLIGDAALNQQKKNFKNTLQFFNRFLGINSECPDQLKEEEKFITYKLVPLENKKIGIEVTLRGTQQILTPEQVLAYYLKKTKKFFENSGIMSNDIVITVPSYYSNSERQAVLDASEIAGLKCIRLINESTAIALNYGFFRKQDLPDKDPRNVVFVDLGHSKLTVTIASFLKGKMRIICHNSDRNLGARQMDTLLVEKLGEEFTKKVGSDPRKNIRCRLRMLDVIEKQRKILSSNKEATIHLESLLEDEDLHKNIQRQEFEELIAPMIEKFTALLQETLERSGLKKDQIHSIEMVGEATRIPLIQQKSMEVFGKDQVCRTLNSLECVARGASLQAAMLSPLFKVSDYEVQEYNYYPVSITYQFPGEAESKLVTKELFPLGSSFPSTKTITFENKKGGMDLLIHYSNGVQLLPGLPTQVSQHKIKEGKPKHEKHSFVVRVSNNIHQIPCLESAEYTEEWQEEEKIPIKKDAPTPPKKAEQPPQADKPADAQQQDTEMKEENKEAPKQEFEVRKKAKKASHNLTVDTSSHALPPGARTQFTQQENTWFNEDSSILEFKAIKNDLESYTYELKNNIDSYGPYEQYIEENQKVQALQKLNQTVEWIYGDGQTASKEAYKQRLDEFKAIGIPVKNRYRFYSEIDIYKEQFRNFTQDVNDRFSNATNLTDQGRQDIISKVTEMESYFHVINQTIASKKPFEDVGFDIDEVHHKFDAFKITVNSLFNAPPPKQDAKQEQPKPKDEDVNMKEEIPSADEQKNQ